MKTQHLIFSLIVLLFFACSTEKQDSEGTNKEEQTADYIAEKSDPIYAEHVRTTSFQLPEDEKNDFILPPGFEITLFASEPDITKPINMAFDEKGRLDRKSVV